MAICSEPACGKRATRIVHILKPDPTGKKPLGDTFAEFCEEHGMQIYIDVEAKRINEGLNWRVTLEQIIYSQSPSPERR